MAIASKKIEIAAETCDKITNWWLNLSRYKEAETLCLNTVLLCDDFRIWHNLARAETVLGKTERAKKNYEKALSKCPDINNSTRESVLGERATILHNMAGVIAQQGDIERAMKLWEQSLKLKEQIGDVQGKAATLANMAGVIAQQGDIERAMKLWEQSLKLKEQIGDVQGKAATLNNMAGVIAQQGRHRTGYETMGTITQT